ncbi:ubiquitin-like protein Pup [Nesterenkonia natronophila]|uniref:Prokaryotic ubiquitin-like protein Pup n=1 Tax=Nesterenkonia natronophila TaxID=2174932 RepID=A0A3A4F7V9_9MICC|nr:ubiquitin-like protein Pup [Nesterenkonia natronophila]RJN31337.1 ubiquitin-like protein Pup [Nesterenkonia natronophila]
MSAQPQKQPYRHGDGDQPESADAAQVQGNPQATERAAELDSLLDEIDTVLEANAEEFVKGFVQKGGQ